MKMNVKKAVLIAAQIALVLAFASAAKPKKSKAPAKTEAPKPAPYVFTPTEEGDSDLSKATSVDYRGLKFDEATGVLSAKGVESFQVPLPEELPAGTKVNVHMIGKNNGTVGFRCWLIDNNQKTLADPLYLDAIGDKLPAGSFDLSFTLNASGSVTAFFVKGPQYGTMIDDIELTKVVLTYTK